MSRGDLQEMEQSKTAVNANAKPAEPMPKLTTGGIPPNVEDLGGPTPENLSLIPLSEPPRRTPRGGGGGGG